MQDRKKEFSEIYDQYIERIYRFVFLKVNSQEIAEDIASETFLRGWKSFQQKDFKIENTSAFLYQIARNLVTDFYRKKGKYKIVTLENVPLEDQKQDLSENLHLENDFALAQKALSKLKSDYQDLIIWHYLDELSISEISKILDKSERAVRTQLSRAMKALRKVMSND